MGGRPCFSCAPGHETLAAELAELVDGTWETTAGIANVMIMANGATVPGALPVTHVIGARCRVAQTTLAGRRILC